MAQLVVRDLPEDVKERLRVQAKSQGRSLEAEVRDILTKASQQAPKSSATACESVADILLREQAKTPISAETWEEFNRNLSEVRRSWKVRDVGFEK